MYCDKCFYDYHSSGFRRTHNYKRIRFGDKPSGGENQEPNLKSSLKQGNENEEKKNVKFIDDEEKVGTVDDFIFKVKAPKKREVLFGKEYLRSLKGRIDFDEVQGFEIADDGFTIRLANLEEGLRNFKEEFILDDDEIEKICQTVEEFCKCDPPLEEEEDDDAVLKSWVNIELFQ